MGAVSEDKPASTTPAGAREPSARPRPCLELGQRFAELLAEPHAHQLGVCAKLRISYASYKRWMAADLDAEGVSTDVADFQVTVMQALEAERVKDIQKLDTEFDTLDGPRVAVAGPLVNKHTFHHQNRFRRFYANDEEPKRTEVDIGNKGGEPFKQHHAGALTEESRRAIVTQFLGLTPELLEAGAKAGDVDMSSPSGEGSDEA